MQTCTNTASKILIIFKLTEYVPFLLDVLCSHVFTNLIVKFIRYMRTNKDKHEKK